MHHTSTLTQTINPPANPAHRVPVSLEQYLETNPAWSRRLLGLDRFSRVRDRSLVAAEYDAGLYAECLRNHEADPEAVVRKTISADTDEPVTISLGQHLFRLPKKDFLSLKQNWMASILDQFAPNGPLCELGAGYGQNFLWLAQKDFHDLYGGEFSSNAVKLGRLLGHQLVGFDFHEPASYDFIRPDSTVMTCHAVEQIPDAAPVVANILRRLGDRVVVHFEPLFREDRDSFLGMLRQRYSRLNDYNHNLLTTLAEHPEVEIVHAETDVIGRNPLNPTSVVVWRRRAENPRGIRP